MNSGYMMRVRSARITSVEFGGGEEGEVKLSDLLIW